LLLTFSDGIKNMSHTQKNRAKQNLYSRPLPILFDPNSAYPSQPLKTITEPFVSYTSRIFAPQYQFAQNYVDSWKNGKSVEVVNKFIGAVKDGVPLKFGVECVKKLEGWMGISGNGGDGSGGGKSGGGENR
jgi:hypothetical protein